jgi:hypothetical protein
MIDMARQYLPKNATQNLIEFVNGWELTRVFFWQVVMHVVFLTGVLQSRASYRPTRTKKIDADICNCIWKWRLLSALSNWILYTATRWTWLAYELTWQYMRRSAENSSAILGVGQLKNTWCTSACVERSSCWEANSRSDFPEIICSYKSQKFIIFYKVR